MNILEYRKLDALIKKNNLNYIIWCTRNYKEVLKEVKAEIEGGRKQENIINILLNYA